MKKISISVVLLITFALFGCSKNNEVSGRSMRSAYKSVNYIKNRLPTETRIEFEMSFWMLRDEIKDNSDFLSKVGGKIPEELIEIGKELYQKRKSLGYKDYDKFSDWNQMISHYNQKRLDQGKRKQREPRDKGNSVIYKL
jgi:hypothetical protein